MQNHHASKSCMFKPSWKGKPQTIYIIVCFFDVYLFFWFMFCTKRRCCCQLLRLFWTGEALRFNLWFGIEFEGENTRASKTNRKFAPKNRPSPKMKFLVSQNTKLVRGCVFAFRFLTMLSLNGLKFTMLFTPLVCCSECSWRFMITRL